MTREELSNICIDSVRKNNCILLELATGVGKTKISLDMVKCLISMKARQSKISMLLLVAKTVHKQTWMDEISKWGGLQGLDSLTIECYESLKKYEGKHFDIIVMDEIHHVGSDKRLDILKTISYDTMIGLSATIPKKLKSYLQYEYHAKVISCNVTEAIESDVLPEPRIILYPLQLDRVNPTEVIEINPKARGKVHHGTYDKLWSYKKMKIHALITCTQRQRVNEFNGQILFDKRLYATTRGAFARSKWLFDCGERIKYLANLKNDVIKGILQVLDDKRTITFCKTIEQAECLGKYAIHSKNPDADDIYRRFNAGEINHITSVNILNENANLVDCKYAIFANYSASESIMPQRIGRSLRHKSPVIIMPYYEVTREEEIVNDMLEGFNNECIVKVHSLEELKNYL